MRAGTAAQPRETPPVTTPTHSNGPEKPQCLPQTPGHPGGCQDPGVGHIVWVRGSQNLCHSMYAWSWQMLCKGSVIKPIWGALNSFPVFLL